MNLADIINTDLQAIHADLGSPVMIWQDEEYECIPSSTGKALSLEEGGFAIESDLVLTVRKELFADVYPKSSQDITYRSVSYRINAVRTDVTDTFIRLFCSHIKGL
jgi:hypothetical protein